MKSSTELKFEPVHKPTSNFKENCNYRMKLELCLIDYFGILCNSVLCMACTVHTLIAVKTHQVFKFNFNFSNSMMNNEQYEVLKQ